MTVVVFVLACEPGVDDSAYTQFVDDIPEGGVAVFSLEPIPGGDNTPFTRDGQTVYRTIVLEPWVSQDEGLPALEDEEVCTFTDYRNPPTVPFGSRFNEFKRYLGCGLRLTIRVEAENERLEDDEKCLVASRPLWNEATGVSDVHSTIECPE